MLLVVCSVLGPLPMAAGRSKRMRNRRTVPNDTIITQIRQLRTRDARLRTGMFYADYIDTMIRATSIVS